VPTIVGAWTADADELGLAVLLVVTAAAIMSVPHVMHLFTLAGADARGG
jgi:hypothetical protein